MAGLYFAFSTAVVAALGGLSKEQGIAAMQKINAAILNRQPSYPVLSASPALSGGAAKSRNARNLSGKSRPPV
jgi:hypothetical protein